jgi:RHS repeat-associated protein
MYDTETNLYYLQSRYYNPEWCRFINADTLIQTGTDILDKNMFAYCSNNPINRNDTNGQSWSDFWNDVKNFNLFNKDEQKVLDAKYISIYKGKIAIKTTSKKGCFSFGAIFISNEKWADADMVKHEYGHTKQLEMLGPAKYTAGVVIPSLISASTNSAAEHDKKPFEVSATILGGADVSKLTAKEKIFGMSYLAALMLI